MAEEVLALLKLPKVGIVIDGTVGMGGHAVLIAEQLGPQGHLIGIDRDQRTLAQA